MSGDNEDIQTAEETPVDEKVTLTMQQISSNSSVTDSVIANAMLYM